MKYFLFLKRSDMIPAIGAKRKEPSIGILVKYATSQLDPSNRSLTTSFTTGTIIVTGNMDKKTKVTSVYGNPKN